MSFYYSAPLVLAKGLAQQIDNGFPRKNGHQVWLKSLLETNCKTDNTEDMSAMFVGLQTIT